MLDALKTCRTIHERYRSYLLSTFSPRSEKLRTSFELQLDGEFPLVKGPYLQATAPYETGASTRDLIAEGVLSRGLEALPDDAFPLDRSLYRHQEVSIRKAVEGQRNLVITTGTGSGKTECFLLPILDSLLKEQEAGTLSRPGVRALLLYPMNALANDQVKRLRRLLVGMPQVTFGRYIGETDDELTKAEESFRTRYPHEPRIPNELLARRQMRSAPPHILLTNFAMLEYLLLRPTDSAFFDGSMAGSWKFFVLDEVHVYNGAKGAEIAMLLRRLRDRVLQSRRGHLRCFATSATLGRGVSDYPALTTFATQLFDEPFEYLTEDPTRQDVIGADRKALVRGEGSYELPEALYPVLRDAVATDVSGSELRTLVESLSPGVSVPSADDGVPRFLADLLGQDLRVIRLQKLLQGGSVPTRRAAQEAFGSEEKEAALVALVDLGVKARHHLDDAPLIPTRYHFFLRALEGGFSCLDPRHPVGEASLFLNRREACPSCARKDRRSPVFELGICRRCGAEYVVGRLDSRGSRRVLLPPKTAEGVVQYFLIGSVQATDDEDEAAAQEEEAPTDVTASRVFLCPGCGSVSEGEEPGKCACEQPPEPVQLTPVKAGADNVVRRCAACSSRTGRDIIFRFVTGSDAPVSVIATDLYQALPPSSDESQLHLVGEGRKLLTFSDSRQDAAFFASYFERTYGSAIQKRLVDLALRGIRDDRPRMDDLVTQLVKVAEHHQILDRDEGRSRKRAIVAAWVMREVLGLEQNLGIEGTGVAEISIAIPAAYSAPAALLRLGFDATEVTDLILMLLETVRTSGAVTMFEGLDVQSDYFRPRNREMSIRGQGPESRILSWVPGQNTNRRLEILRRVMARKRIEADPGVLLQQMWDYLSDARGPWAKTLLARQDKRSGALWVLDHERMEFVLADKSHRPLVCSQCRRIWWRTVAGVCAANGCDGIVRPLESDRDNPRRHYADLYQNIAPIGMNAEEHTAQWTQGKASGVQDEFINGRINVLSCSTTFELGVDVGEVQGVLLRNVPPTPANYVQRAGRAGRRTDAVALVVTFAQRRSHDLSYFSRPTDMVDGTIDPPRILLENPFIIRRHLHSVAFSAFQRRCYQATGESYDKVANFFVGSNGEAGVDKFLGWLDGRPAELEAALRRWVPTGVQDSLGLTSWDWVEALRNPTDVDTSSGWLGRATDEARGDFQEVAEAIAEAAKAERYDRAASLKGVQKTLERRDLLGYLAARNVLPKYGFPVDVVEMDLLRTGDPIAQSLNLDRDLKLAITEYAPGNSVVAGKRQWTSAGLKVRPQHVLPPYQMGFCGACERFRFGLGEIRTECACGAPAAALTRQRHFVVPVFGFIGKLAAERPGDMRPSRNARYESWFGEYRGAAPDWAPVAGLSRHPVVETRHSRQGLIVVVNSGSFGYGYRLCDRCGFGDAIKADQKDRKGAPRHHDDPRWPGRKCTGTLARRSLGHQFLTDVLELRVGSPMSEPQARSAVYALLAAVPTLGIERSDMDGTVDRSGQTGSPSLVLFDQVPGGAGHALHLSERLPALIRSARNRVAACECGVETSCYACLRTYSNQYWHDSLTREGALRVLDLMLGSEGAERVQASTASPAVDSELGFLDERVRGLVEPLLAEGIAEPVAGWEAQDADGVILGAAEAAWPREKVAIVLDEVGDRDKWLKGEGFRIVVVNDETTTQEIRELFRVGKGREPRGRK